MFSPHTTITHPLPIPPLLSLSLARAQDRLDTLAPCSQSRLLPEIRGHSNKANSPARPSRVCQRPTPTPAPRLPSPSLSLSLSLRLLCVFCFASCLPACSACSLHRHLFTAGPSGLVVDFSTAFDCAARPSASLPLLRFVASLLPCPESTTASRTRLSRRLQLATVAWPATTTTPPGSDST